jgi:hypothetical protein
MLYLTKDNFNIEITEQQYNKILDVIYRDGVVIKDIYDDVMKDCKLNEIINELERPVKKEYYIIAIQKCDACSALKNDAIPKYMVKKIDMIEDVKMACYVTFLMPKLVKHEHEEFQIYAFVKQKCIIVMDTSEFIFTENEINVNKYYSSNTFNPLMKDCPFNEEVEMYQFDTNMEYSILKIEEIDM